MTRPRVSGSSKSMMIISPWAKVENRAIAVPSGMIAVAKPIAVMNTERHDIVSVAANATLYPPSGFFDPNDPKTSHTVNIRLGDYNDRGDSSHQLKDTGPTVVGAVAVAYGSPTAGVAVKAVGDKTVAGVSKAFQSADPGTYVGDIKIHVDNDQNDHVSAIMAPNTNATDRNHVNPPMNSKSFQLNGPRAEYWPKLAVLVH